MRSFKQQLDDANKVNENLRKVLKMYRQRDKAYREEVTRLKAEIAVRDANSWR